MKSDLIPMSSKDLTRLEILQRVADKRLTQRRAADHLGLTTRQVRRLTARYEEAGAAGLVSRRIGRPSNNRLSASLKETCLTLVREKYADFGPAFANEKLREIHGLKVANETLRKWMTRSGLWVPRDRRRAVHQPRHRRECVGELIQIDGSPHAWFESRGPPCTLLVFIDDATSRLMQLRFVPTETTFDYLEATKRYILEHGKPIAFYSDKHTVFRVADSRVINTAGQTQYGRALSELNIDIICANTPQAKGRVERANLTLQNRLVKELRLRGISNLEDANAFVPTFIASHNARFAKAPLNPYDAHRPLVAGESLISVMCLQSERKISKNLVVHHQRKMYHIAPTAKMKRYAGKLCTVYEWADGRIALRCKDEDLPFTVFDKNPLVKQAAIVENKVLGTTLEFLRQRQLQRHAERLANPNLTKRERASLEAQLASCG